MGTESQIEHNLEIHRTFEHGEPCETSLESRSNIHVLSIYVKRHHAPEKITGDQKKDTMTRKKLKGTCFLKKIETITVNDALKNES